MAPLALMRRSLRDLIVPACGILCVAGLVAGVVNIYLAGVLFDSERFADRAAASLAQPEIAALVAEQAADQIIEARRDLIAYRPILLSTAEYLIASGPVRAVVRRGAHQLHTRLLSSAGQDILLSAGDLGIIIDNALASYPGLAGQIPASAQVVLGRLEDLAGGRYIARILSLGYRLRMFAALGLVIGVAAGATGVILTRRRDRYLLRLGLGLAAAAFLAAGLARFGGELGVVLARTETVATLIRSGWPVFLSPLVVRLLFLGGLGVVLVAAVTSLLEKIEPTRALRSVLTEMARMRSTRWRFMRGALLVAAGWLVLSNPQGAVLVLAVLAGALLLFEGTQEILVTAVRFAPRVRESVTQARQGGRRGPAAGVFVAGALLLCGLAAALAWMVDRSAKEGAAATSADACNGEAFLCARRLNEVAFAATHNSMAAADIADWMFPNQERGLRAQLEDGIRGFLVDIHYGVPVGGRIKTLLENEAAAREKYEASLGPEGVAAALRIRDRLVGGEEGERGVYLAHGFCELGATRFVSWLEVLRRFLSAHPGEVVIIIIQDEGVTPSDVARCFEESDLISLVYRGPVHPPWPTLGEMVDLGERVVVFAENDAAGVPWLHRAEGVIQETPYRFHSPSEFSNEPNRGGATGSLLLLNHWIETTPAPSPNNAALVNEYEFLLSRALDCRRERGLMPNLLAVDFYRTGDLLAVVRALNQLEETGDSVRAGPAPEAPAP